MCERDSPTRRPGRRRFARRLGGLLSAVLFASVLATAGGSRQADAALAYETLNPTPGPLGPITVIGDSVLVGAMIYGPTLSDHLAAQGWGPVRVRAGRGYTTGRFNVSTEAKASYWVNRWRSEGWDTRDVVVNIGANDSGFCETSLRCARDAIAHLVDAIGPGHRIWWAKMTHNPYFRSYQDNWNTALDQIAAERANVVVWDWPTIMATGPFPSTDGIHLTPAGYRTRSQLMSRDITSNFAMASHVGGDAELPTATAAPSGFVPLTSTRAIDTRSDPPGRLAAHQTVEVDVSAFVPPGTTAVAAYVVAVDPDASGYLTAFDCADGRPLAANANYGPHETRGAVAITSVDTDGKLCVYTFAGADLVVDVQGAFVPDHADAVGFAPLPEPLRLADTRTTDGPRQLTIVDAPAGASAVVVNVTAIQPPAGGYLVVYPCSAPRPDAATVNYLPGDVVGGAAFVPVGDDGTVCVWSLLPIDVTVDLAGTFSADPGGLLFVPVRPTRTIDSRNGVGGWSPIHGQHQTINARVAPASARAVSGTLTIAGPYRSGYLKAWGCAGTSATASVNALAGGVLSNLVTTGVDAEGRLCVLSSAAASSIFDTSGWWVGP